MGVPQKKNVESGSLLEKSYYLINVSYRKVAPGSQNWFYTIISSLVTFSINLLSTLICMQMFTRPAGF